jgi:cell division protein FtsW (lipid II flippase)
MPHWAHVCRMRLNLPCRIQQIPQTAVGDDNDTVALVVVAVEEDDNVGRDAVATAGVSVERTAVPLLLFVLVVLAEEVGGTMVTVMMLYCMLIPRCCWWWVVGCCCCCRRCVVALLMHCYHSAIVDCYVDAIAASVL